MKKVSFVCTSYRRFYCVKRIVAQYQAQTYPNKELIIFNTDEEYPYSLGIEDDSIIIVNRQNTSGTIGSSLDITARTAGTSFTITSNGGGSDTSTISWVIIEPY